MAAYNATAPPSSEEMIVSERQLQMEVSSYPCMYMYMLGVLCCLLASFSLPSHLSFNHVYTYYIDFNIILLYIYNKV